MPSINSIKFNYGRFLQQTDLVGSLVPVRPTVITWSRLEPLPYNEDLTDGLQAKIADPLWMLGRQWQFSEFQGEDGGSPIWSKLDGDLGHLSRYQAVQADAAVHYQHRQIPLEVQVEREDIRTLHPRLAAEAGEHFLRLLAAEGITTARPLLRQQFPLGLSLAPDTPPQADPAGYNWQRLCANRAIDGVALAAALQDSAPSGELTALPASLRGLEEAPALAAANRWLTWYAQHLSEPQANETSAWQPERLEYRFRLSTRLDDQDIVLTADEYTDGRLDWYSFQAAAGPRLEPPTESQDQGQPTDFKPAPLLPTPVRYPGMPADRYWEFEDAQVNLGYLEAGPTDLGRMLLAEFGLVFSNDWFVIPVEMPVGSVFQVNSLRVRDTFGETITVQPARNFDGSRWTMFSLTGTERLPSRQQDLFFLPPTLPFRLEGDPIEEVLFFRDETANLAWALEQKVPGASGQAMDRRMEPPTEAVYQRIDLADITADLVYRLMTPVADNWLPFVPVPPQDAASPFRFSVGLERRTLLKTRADGTRQEVHPKGIITRSDLSQPVADEPPLRLFEEEVPRAGARVQRAFQYTRWLDGSRHLWVGRQKGTGRGEGSSGLRFDIATFASQKATPLANQRPQVARASTLKLIESSDLEE